MAPLRGRGAESAELAKLITTTVGGAAGAVVLAGAPGIGKSRLIAEAAGLAAGRDIQVAAAAADELDQVTAWGVLLKALSATCPEPVLGADDLAALPRMIDQRLAVVELIGSAIEQASSRRPPLIMLDDLQWADPATVSALGSLPARAFSCPVGWLLALRPQPSSPQLDSLMARLAAEGAAILRLLPLDRQASAELAGDLLGAAPDRDLTALITQAAGNPPRPTGRPRRTPRRPAHRSGRRTRPATRAARDQPARPPCPGPGPPRP